MTERSQRLALAGLSGLVLVLLVAHGLFAFGRTGLFFYIGQDYRAFRALAEVVSEEGFLAAYDLEKCVPYSEGAA